MCRQYSQACQTLNLPIFITEQYRKDWDQPSRKILEALQGKSPLQKMTFSCCGSQELLEQISSQKIKQLIVTGIESHVCVQQTALDLLAQEIQVRISKDAVYSRKELDYKTALKECQRPAWC